MKKLNIILRTLLKCIPTVGDVELNFSGINPSTKYPNTTWEQRAQGRALVGVGSNGYYSYSSRQTFGADQHTLTVAEMPSHTHPFHHRPVYRTDASSYGGISWADSTTVPGEISAAGGNGAHNNRQCSIALYVWERTK